MIGTQYQALAVRVDALQLRERLMLLIVSIVFLFFLVDSMGFQPVYKKQQLLLEDIKELELQLKVLHARSTQLYDDHTSERSIPLENLQQQLSNFGQKLRLRLDTMLPPDTATSVLEQVMTHEEGLTLNAVNTRQAPLTTIETGTGKEVVIDDISRHELELQLEGGYLETLYYLRALEALPYKFIWTSISFATTEHPNAIVDLEIYTLGQVGNLTSWP